MGGTTGRGAPATLAVDGAVATIALDRGERMNPIDVEMAACLRGLGNEVARRDDVRVLVLEGRGRAFCAGGDIAMFATRIDDLAPSINALLDEYHEFLLTLRVMPQVVVTKLHGAVAGAGLSLAFMGDLAVAADDARFVPGYAKLGVTPDGGGTIGLVERAGRSRALAIFLGRESFTAAEADRWGLLDVVVPRADLDGATQALARRLAGLAPAALAGTKRLIGGGDPAALRTRLEAERASLLACMEGEGFRAAVLRFAGGTPGRAA